MVSFSRTPNFWCATNNCSDIFQHIFARKGFTTELLFPLISPILPTFILSFSITSYLLSLCLLSLPPSLCPLLTSYLLSFSHRSLPPCLSPILIYSVRLRSDNPTRQFLFVTRFLSVHHIRAQWFIERKTLGSSRRARLLCPISATGEIVVKPFLPSRAQRGFSCD